MDIKTSKQLIIFDLDSTLTPSKSPLDSEMAQLLFDLLAKKKVAIISGCGYPQFEIQILSKMSGDSERLTNLFILPTSGTKLYVWRGGWCEQYAEHLSKTDKEVIMVTLGEALKTAKYVPPEKPFGALIEDRGSQITFSALGQAAPVELKSVWDPTREKRQFIADIIKKKLPRFDVRVGGMTSVDITMKGVNKGYGIRKLEEFLHMPIDDMVFIGDSLFHGGNDYPAKATGVDCISVNSLEDTKKIIREIIG